MEQDGVRLEWRDGGGCTHLVWVTELGRMLGNDPTMVLSVLSALGGWAAGKHARVLDLRRGGWIRVGEEGDRNSSSSSSPLRRRSGSSTSSNSGGGTRPPLARPQEEGKKEGQMKKLRERERFGRGRPHTAEEGCQTQRKRTPRPSTPPNPKSPPRQVGATNPTGKCHVQGRYSTSLETRGEWGDHQPGHRVGGLG